MTLDQLKYFLAAAQYEHVTRAGIAVHISASVISSSIKALEEELKSKLFNRVGRRIVLTEKGRLLRQEAEKILNEVSSLHGKLNQTSSFLSGHYRVSASHTLSSRYLAPAISVIQNKHPKLKFELTATSTALIVSDVLAGRLEAGLCYLPVKHPDLDEQILYQGDHEIIVRQAHPLLKAKSKKPISSLHLYPATFHKVSAAHDLLTYASFMKNYGVKNLPVSTYDNADTGIGLILSSNAWTIIPDLLVKDFSQKISVIKKPKDWVMPLRISFIRRKDNTSDIALNELHATLKSLYKD